MFLNEAAFERVSHALLLVANAGGENDPTKPLNAYQYTSCTSHYADVLNVYCRKVI